MSLKGTDSLRYCRKFYEFEEGRRAEGYACSKVKCPPDSAEHTLYIYETEGQLKEMTLGDVQAKYCPQPESSSDSGGVGGTGGSAGTTGGTGGDAGIAGAGGSGGTGGTGGSRWHWRICWCLRR